MNPISSAKSWADDNINAVSLTYRYKSGRDMPCSYMLPTHRDGKGGIIDASKKDYY